MGITIDEVKNLIIGQIGFDRPENKQLVGYLLTDLIEMAKQEVIDNPGDYDLIPKDEAQDWVCENCHPEHE